MSDWSGTASSLQTYIGPILTQASSTLLSTIGTGVSHLSHAVNYDTEMTALGCTLALGVASLWGLAHLDRQKNAQRECDIDTACKDVSGFDDLSTEEQDSIRERLWREHPYTKARERFIKAAHKEGQRIGSEYEKMTGEKPFSFLRSPSSESADDTRRVLADIASNG